MHEKRRIGRISIGCAVVVREKATSWSADTEDVGARGCRITLMRPLKPGTLVQLRFERGEGEPALEVVGQVAWARTTPPLVAGVAFVDSPREPSGARPRNWVDAIVATQLRRMLEATSAGVGRPAWLGGTVLHPGAAPAAPLDGEALAVARLARDGAPLSALCRSKESIAALATLLERGVLSVCREGAEADGWKRVLAAPAPGRTAPPEPARPASVAVIVPPAPPPERKTG